ncbi:hypothetical protein CHS0354_027056 [Potamilus streckersoni]|uniref:BTB domain-containing protein n=1 Tax=Potamilus streckersoni TaxID=2493646 RepID=A0AAE0VGW0_9BIVA|nr:hypothetical protein CHS0354_027056 [Potamilus streckersoni]
MQCPKVSEKEKGPVELESGDEEEKTETLSDLFRKSKLTDITLVVGEDELHFSKYLLMEASDVLTKLIEESEDKSRLKLTDVEYHDLVLFLACLHPKQLMCITDKRGWRELPHQQREGEALPTNRKIGWLGSIG